MVKAGDTFNIGEICPESGVYKVKQSECKASDGCVISKDQLTIPLVKGKRFPPCKDCHGPIVWEFIKKA